MKKLFVPCLVAVVLVACGSSANETLLNDRETVTVYNNDHTLIHQMEGVNLTLDYNVQEIIGKVVGSDSTSLEPGDFLIEMTGTLNNNFEDVIYYDASFTLQTNDGLTLEQVSSSVEQQLEVASGTQKTFTTVYVISDADYESNSELNLRVPAAFKEPNSESSGDALGDFTIWQIPIK